MTDPVQLLLSSGAIPSTPFGPSSRYFNVATGSYEVVIGEAPVAYVLRRFVPQMRDIPLATVHTVIAGDRIDLLANSYLGDAELTWRIADANAATDQIDLTSTPGLRLAIPLPPGT